MNWLQNTIAIVISFLIARIMIDSDIHRTFLHHLLKKSGANYSSFLTGILFTAYFFSIFFSNTVVVLSMIPMVKIILDGIEDPKQRQALSTPVILALIYGANIGGMGSLTGSPLNILYTGIIELYKIPGRENVTFFTWFLLGIPASLVLVLISRLVLKLSEKGLLLTETIQIKDESLGKRNVTKYTLFFVGNILCLILLTALQFSLKPKPIFYSLNPIDLLMIFYLLGFLFFGFIFPRGTQTPRKYQQNALFLVLFLVLIVPISLVEIVKEVVIRFRLKGIRLVRRAENGLISLFNCIWVFFFKERQPHLKSKNPHSFISLNRLVYDLPFFGLLFMALMLVGVYLLVSWGDNPATPQLDGFLLRFFEALSAKLVPTGDQVFLFVFVIVMICTFFTELVNNTTVVLLMFPLVLKISSALPFNPLFALLAVTIGASSAFMTPIATPVNAICYASFKEASLKKMLAFGFVLNILGGIFITVLFYFLGTYFR